MVPVFSIFVFKFSLFKFVSHRMVSEFRWPGDLTGLVWTLACRRVTVLGARYNSLFRRFTLASEDLFLFWFWFWTIGRVEVFVLNVCDYWLFNWWPCNGFWSRWLTSGTDGLGFVIEWRLESLFWIEERLSSVRIEWNYAIWYFELCFLYIYGLIDFL